MLALMRCCAPMAASEEEEEESGVSVVLLASRGFWTCGRGVVPPFKAADDDDFFPSRGLPGW